jgi:GTP-binding protein
VSANTALFFPPGVERDAAVTEEMVLPGSNIVVGPYAGDSRVKEAEFIGCSAHARDCPKDDRPEFAVLGRSNVGKSSLINALTRRKEAALTSKKPGNPFHFFGCRDMVIISCCMHYSMMGWCFVDSGTINVE